MITPFPSGQWSGFYNRTGKPSPIALNLSLSFHHPRRVTGTGSARSARLVLLATCSPTRELVGTLAYDRKLRVQFRAYADGVDGGLWGTWQAANSSPSCQGGFRIWPTRSGGDTASGHEQPANATE